MRRAWPTGILAVAIVGTAVFATNNPLSAQNTGAAITNVACVDVFRVLSEYQRQKDLMEEVRSHEEKFKQEGQRRQQQIDTAKATIEMMRPDDPTYQTKLHDLLQANISFKNWQEVYDAAVGREVGVWTSTMYKEFLDVVAATAQERGYSLVLYKDEFQQVSFDPAAIQAQIRDRKVVYASSNVDISQIVLDRLNAEYRAKPRTPMIRLLVGAP